MIALRVLTPGAAWAAAARGFDVYLFLIGVMLLATLARRHEVFAWLAKAALRASRGSKGRLFLLLYGIGVGITALLSNDTAAVVLTPAVIAVLGRTDAPKMPYLYACAFVASAASFLLPIGNPANLVVFGGQLPPLHAWIASFGPAGVAAVLATFFMLRFALRGPLRGTFLVVGADPHLSPAGKVAASAVGLAAIALIAVNALGGPIGLTAAVAGALAVLISSLRDGRGPAWIARNVSWGILPLVAGLFVVVSGLGATGPLALGASGLRALTTLPDGIARLGIAAAVTAACSVFNNLPVALFSDSAIRVSGIAAPFAHVVLVAVDLGPNLLVTGSLATLLWIITLRRERIDVTPWHFLRLGLAVTLPSLAAAALLVR